MNKTILYISLLFLISCNSNGIGSNKLNKDRIVCVSKQLTEILFALHQGNKIVGVDLSSNYPPEAKKLTSVGYHRHLSAEGIISLDPTLVIHQGDIAPNDVIPKIVGVGIPVKVYPPANTIDSTEQLIRLLGKEFGEDTAATRIVNKMNTDLLRADSFSKTFKTKPRVLIIHFGQQMNQYFVMGTRGTADEMIKLAGGINAADTSSFRTLSPEAILRSQPDIILATDFGYDRMGGKEKFIELPGLAFTPAAKNGKIFRIEEHDLVYFGPRSGENIMKIAILIHQ
ncbi:MAG: hemin ABC transporter substrate-binding protein [Flavisolibacter sp.]